MMDGFDEVIKEFLVESYESLDQLDRDLIELEDAPDDRDRLASIFRTVHTIKGTSGFLALPKLERVAHVGENLLVPLRDGEFSLEHDMADGLLGMVDAIREILGHLENDGGEGEGDYEPLVAQLEGLLNRDLTAADTAPAIARPSEEAEDAVETSEPAVAQVAQGDGTENAATASTETLDAVEQQAETEEQTVAAEQAETEQQTEAEQPPEAEQQAAIESPTEDAPEAQPAAAAASSPPTQSGTETAGSRDTSSSGRGDRSQSLADSTIRIDVSVLDKLMNLVGELVLCRNQIMQFSHTVEDPTIVAASQRLNLITTELQEGVMKTRMQPIRNAWSKLPRVVRDLANGCGKTVQVQMEGADTELDKTILEAIKDPLTHIVRNSVDHGIESSDDRVLAGKPEAGTLWLRAYHESGQVNIEIADDGRGIDLDRVRQKAIEKGLVTAEQAASMNDRELTALILLPGFSTAAEVTNVSGRGVGMDVVKTNIEKIGGTIDIHSTPGKGTTLRIKIPLTLAIVPALIVTTGGDQYAIPQVSLLELVRLDGERAHDEIEFIHDAPVYRLRGNLLPLIYLDEQLELRQKRQRHDRDESVNIVVLQAEDRQFGLVVDAITDTQEIVVKPLGQHLNGIDTYAGVTIMGDGSVALILDVIGLARKSNVLTEHRDRTLGEGKAASQEQLDSREALLIVDPGDSTRAAVPLSTVARLEEFAVSAIERSGQSEVVQYRGQIIPLISLKGGYGGGYGSSAEGGRIQAIIYSGGGRSVGIVVGKIVDIVHERLQKRDGELPQRCVIQDRVTELIDLQQLVRTNCPELFDQFSAA